MKINDTPLFLKKTTKTPLFYQALPFYGKNLNPPFCKKSENLKPSYFSWHSCPSPFYPFASTFFPDVEIFEVFYANITYSSWPNISIHSPEVTKVSKPAPSDLYSDTSYTKLFVELLSSNTLLKLDRSSDLYYCQQIFND